jgi:EAL and modified HD-GYP domain-containing signal transduction protein
MGTLTSNAFHEQPSPLPLREVVLEAPPESRVPEGWRYVARQPILDARGQAHGYELLFRSGPMSTSFDGDSNAATRAVLDNTLIFGLEQLTGGLPVFVNCTEESLLEKHVMVLPPRHTVLELLETLVPTPQLIKVCRELKGCGFRIALDDFEGKPEWEGLVALADYIKVDISTTKASQRQAILRSVAGGKVQLIAERVETREDLEMVRREGFSLFQGYYFCKPVLMTHRKIPANHLIHLEILQAIHQDPLDTKRISDLVKRDASLTFRLLRMINSPLYGMSKVIRSIHAALVLIGDEVFRRVATLAIASELRGQHPSELLRMAFQRGRFCELAAASTGQNPTEQYLLGILSLLPAMLGVPMENIVEALPLSREVRAALLGESNDERIVLEWLICYEQGNWECCDRILQHSGLIGVDLPHFYTQALWWAETNMNLAR